MFHLKHDLNYLKLKDVSDSKEHTKKVVDQSPFEYESFSKLLIDIKKEKI
jgi:hypothetical protein